MSDVPQQFEREVSAGDRFRFGENWQRFLTVLDDERIARAEDSLRQMLGVETLAGKSFIDVGCGSGLFSLAAMRLGAERVHSIDFDPQSVACAEELRRRYFASSEKWTIARGSVLDRDMLGSLGQWDVVYSWGVLHHTGRMWDALENVAPLVRASGILFVSIYNDQGPVSRFWTAVKVAYNRGAAGRALVSSIFVPYWFLRGIATDLLRVRNPARRYRDYRGQRGMSIWYDWHDWLGGYPFEVARPEQIFDFYAKRGFTLRRMTTAGGTMGCNEFVFTRS